MPTSSVAHHVGGGDPDLNEHSATDRLDDHQRLILESQAASAAMEGYVPDQFDQEIAARRMLGHLTGDQAVGLALCRPLLDGRGGVSSSDRAAAVANARSALRRYGVERLDKVENDLEAYLLGTIGPDELDSRIVFTWPNVIHRVNLLRATLEASLADPASTSVPEERVLVESYLAGEISVDELVRTATGCRPSLDPSNPPRVG